MGKALIGNRKHAEDAYNMRMGHPLKHTAPRDWHYLGGGSMRACWHHKPSGVVYKMDTYSWDDDYSNEAELRNSRKARRLAWKNVHIPLTAGFRFKDLGLIVAMEFVSGTLGFEAPREAAKEGKMELYKRGGFLDMHGRNFIVMDSGKVAPIDMGSDFRSTRPDRRLLDCGNGSVW